jgi:hypothetical protein
MLVLLTITKRFAEAHDWALKAIKADPTGKRLHHPVIGCGNEVGRLHLAIDDAGLDYASARAAAGMKPEVDPDYCDAIPHAAGGFATSMRSENGCTSRPC